MKRTRRLLIAGFPVAAVVLAAASVAYACVTFQGKFQVETNRGTSTAFGSGYHPDSTRFSASGRTPNIEYCRPPVGSATAGGTAGNTIQVSFAPYGGCHWVDPSKTESRTNGTQADDGVYVVRFDARQVFCNLRDPDCPPAGLTTPPPWKANAGWFRLNQPTPADLEHRGTQCFYRDVSDTPEIVTLGTMRVDELGFGQGTFAIPPAALGGPTDAAGVCTRELGGTAAERGHPGPPHSNMAPVVVV